MNPHRARYRGWRRVSVVCACGWIREARRSRGEARREHEWHLWHVETDPARPFWATVDARHAR